MALAGFIAAFLSPTPGLILSFMAHKQCQERNEDGQNLATAGIVIAVLNIVLRIALLIFAIALPLIMLTNASHATGNGLGRYFWRHGPRHVLVTPAGRKSLRCVLCKVNENPN